MPARVCSGVPMPWLRHRLLWAPHLHPKYRLCSANYYFRVGKTGVIILDTKTVPINTVIPQPAELSKLCFELINGSMQGVYPSQVCNVILPPTLDGILMLG